MSSPVEYKRPTICFNDGPSSGTVGQHKKNKIGFVFRVCGYAIIGRAGLSTPESMYCLSEHITGIIYPPPPVLHSAGRNSHSAYKLGREPSKHDTLTQCWVDVGRRRRRRANNDPTLGQRVVVGGIAFHNHSRHLILSRHDAFNSYCFLVGPASATLGQP